MHGVQKKDTGTYTAQRAALGGRTLKTGQSRWFVGYKKHTFRLWWREYSSSVMLVPLVSWVAPANVSEGGLLVPSLHYCDRRWAWWPRHVVADMGYLASESKRDRAARSRSPRLRALPLGALLAPSWAAEIALPHGVALRLHAQVSPSWVAELLRSLRASC